MRTLEELRRLFETELSADIDALEARRKRVKSILTVTGILLSCSAAATIYLLYKWDPEKIGLFGSVLVVLVPLFFIWQGLRKLISRTYVLQYRNTIFSKLAQFVDENFKYSPSRYVSRTLFLESEMFLRKPGLYKGKNLFSGKIDDLEIQFSHVEAYIRGEPTLPIFRGRFFVVSYNRLFNGKTIVAPKKDVQETVTGAVASKLFPWEHIKHDQKIRTHYSELDDKFATHSDNLAFTNRIFEADLINKILAFEEKGNYFFLSFIKSKMYVALYVWRAFDPDATKKAYDFNSIQEWYEGLEFVIDVAKTVQSNHSVWTD